MATQEITLKFKGDPSLLKGTLDQLKSQHASAMAEITRQTKQEADSAAALQRQRSSALITIWKSDTRSANAEEKERTRVAAQAAKDIEAEERRLAATMIRESRAAQAVRIRGSREVEQEEKRLAATMIREARAATNAKLQDERRETAEKKRLNREEEAEERRQAAAVAALHRQRSAALLRIWRDEQRERVRLEQQTVRDIQRAQAGVSSGRGGAFLAGAAGGLSALVGVSVVSEIRQAGAAWLDYANKLETTKIAFTTMLGSAELAQAHLNELQQFALKTPFQFGELIDASQRMQALGFSAEQVVPLLTDVGNAVAAAGGGSERLDRVVLALSQMQSKGRVATQELNQLAESGINGFKILEEATGKTRAELVKMVEQGEVSASVFLAAFQKFSQQNFGGLMEQQAKTFSGAMSNIKDALLQTSATAFQPLYDRLNELAKQMADTSTKSKEFREDMAVAGRELARVWDGAVEAIHLLHDTYSLLVAAIVGQVGATLHAFEAVTRGIAALIFQIDALSRAAVGDLRGAFVSMQRSGQQAALAVLALKDATVAAAEPGRELGRIYERAGQRFLDAAKNAAQAAAILQARELASGAPFIGAIGDTSRIGAGITRPKAAPFEAQDKKAKGSDPATAARREAAITLQIALSNIQAEEDALDRSFKNREVNFAHYVARAEVLEAQRHQQVIGGLIEEARAADGLRDANSRSVALKEIELKRIEETNRHKKEQNKLTDESTKLQKELTVFILQQEDALLRLAIGEKSHLRIAQELIENLESQGEALSASTKFWLQHRATILDASEAYKELNDQLERHREAVEASITVPTPEDAPQVDIGPPPKAREEWTIWEELMDSIQLKMVGFTNFIHGTLIGAFHAMTEAVGESIAAWALYGESLGKALKKALASILAQIAAEAAIQALLHAAYAIGSLAYGNFSAAGQHALAALKFTAVAVAAGVGARLVAGNSFQSASGGGSANAGSGASGTAGAAPARQEAIPARDINRTPGAPNATLTLQVPDGWFEKEFRKDFDLNGYSRLVITSRR